MDTCTLEAEGYVITFSVPPKNGMACRLYPGGEQATCLQLRIEILRLMTFSSGGFRK